MSPSQSVRWYPPTHCLTTRAWGRVFRNLSEARTADSRTEPFFRGFFMREQRWFGGKCGRRQIEKMTNIMESPINKKSWTGIHWPSYDTGSVTKKGTHTKGRYGCLKTSRTFSRATAYVWDLRRKINKDRSSRRGALWVGRLCALLISPTVLLLTIYMCNRF